MITRRTFVQILMLLPLSAYASELLAHDEKDRILNLYNTHTGERIHVRYCSCGVYDKAAIDGINRLLRC
ncbi:MAG TPA: hypothetical protein VLX29_10855, partial [Nitrospirota bacterium]|nr:hypothetical protein [Nitrospirota bacterium]